eukprot:CAMPEP_0201879326 /NCGR_PEP_ID=MMETSP0902-20130614/10237_1 /ASSEMBLY_ACC=CAM_ASM_000551 /TAXON_ID=420261 /ORGANISM="Thalassiosira antarctica, Strain CCMP982" /LENGTH=701 /DNA_ID=CAMNT_0048407125 /DNA_START=119 /DNA_END=2224 /DNA_ORIENTATION=-
MAALFSLASPSIDLSIDRVSLKEAMADNGIILSALETHVDTDFNIGEVMQPTSSSAAPSAADSVTSASASAVSGGDVGALGTEEAASSVPSEVNNSVPKIVCAGKGGALYLPAIFSKVMELSGKENPNVVYIGTASFDADKNFNRHGNEFTMRGCLVERLDVSEPDTVPPHEEMRRLVVDWADVVVCSGGNTLHSLLRWKDVGLDLLLKEAAEKGTVLCGGSAGAGCWFHSMHSDSMRPDNTKHADVAKSELDDDELEDWEFVKISGLGLVPGPDIMAVPHFDRTGTNDMSRSDHAEQVLLETENETPGAIAFGIDNNAAFVVTGDSAMVVSGDGEATCHVVVADEETGETSTAPLVPQDEPIPIEELMLANTPATAEHLDTLGDHVETNFSIAEDLLEPPTTTTDSATEDASALNSHGGSSQENEQVSNLKIVAAGRMKTLQLPPVFEKVIELSGKEQPKIVYIGTASFDRTDKYNLCTKAFRELECEIERLDVSETDTVPTYEEMRRLVVDWAEVIICSGGNTLHALLCWKETGLDLLLKEAAEKGTVLCGGSAGAGCWFSSIHSDSLRPDNVKNSESVKNELDEDELTDWEYVKISGLGIIPAMAVPHYDMTGTNDVSRSENAEQMMEEEQDGVPAFGIDENAALVIEGDMASAVSGDGKATCHVVVTDEETGETTTETMTPGGKPQNIHEVMDVQTE